MSSDGPVCDVAGLPEPTREQIALCEARASRAWPAEHVIELSGWQMRYAPQAQTRRTNSVLAIQHDHAIEAGDDIVAALDAVEEFYGEHGLPARFQISPASLPVGLDDLLEDRSYEREAPTMVQWACVDDVAQRCVDDGAGTLMIAEAVTPDWARVYGEGAEDDADLQGRLGVIERIAAPCVLVVAYGVDGKAASVGLGVFEDDWCAVYCMHTLGAVRRRGYADRVLGALARWTDERGGTHMYLQVEDSNALACAFYARRGFASVYSYHYRTRY